MVRERIFLQLSGKRLVSYKKLENGETVGTGLLNPIIDRFRLIIMLIFQYKFYKTYNLGQWRGNRVANTFSPPIGSRAMFRAIKNVIRGKILRHARPIAMTFAVTYKCQCNCVHCSAGKHLKKDVPELTTEEAKKLIDDSQKLGISILAFTGGEPLLQKDLKDLLKILIQNNYDITIETNGSLDISDLIDYSNVIISLDIKCPSSGMNKKMCFDNISHLDNDDQLKFIIGNKEDFEYAKKIVQGYKIFCPIFFQPVESIIPKELAGWILNDGLNVKLGLQIHKIIWEGKRGF